MAPSSRPRRGRPGYDLASVLAVAVELFNERGYDGTSMRDLAARLGIAKSAIYHHVTGKEELLSLALDRALAGLAVVTNRARALPRRPSSAWSTSSGAASRCSKPNRPTSPCCSGCAATPTSSGPR